MGGGGGGVGWGGGGGVGWGVGHGDGDGDGDGESSGTSGSSGSEMACDANDGQPDPENCVEVPDLFCVAGSCADCRSAAADASCALLSADTGACRDDGRCVQCTTENDDACQGQTPICDGGDNSCRGCVDHDECTAACDLATGECMPDDKIWYVEQMDSGCHDSTATGDAADPFCGIGFAISRIEDDSKGTIIIVDDGDGWEDDLQIDGKRTVAILAEKRATFSAATEEAPAILVEDGATLYLVNAKVRHMASGDDGDPDDEMAIQCRYAAMWLDDVRVQDTEGLGVSSEECNVTIENSRVQECEGGGVRFDGGELSMYNTLISENGDNSINVSTPAIYLNDMEHVEIVYCTVADNEAHDDHEGAVSLDCGPRENRGEIRNSIFVADDGDSLDSEACPNDALEFGFNAVDDDAFDDAPNKGVGDYDPEMFTGNFQLDTNKDDYKQLEDIAHWAHGDPEKDINGTARPQDQAGYPGIDEPA